MIWGADDGVPMTRQNAAKHVGLADVTLRQALANPLVLRFYNEQLEVLRTGERPRSIHKIAELRDKAESERVSLEAAKYLDGGDKPGGITINNNIATNITPGYVIAIPQNYVEPARQMLKLAGSTANVLENQGDVAHSENATP